jgi:hypothetical protein
MTERRWDYKSENRIEASKSEDFPLPFWNDERIRFSVMNRRTFIQYGGRYGD